MVKGLDRAGLPGHITYRGKVLALFTLFKINNLSVYTKPYIFCKVFTSLIINDLSVYINVNGILMNAV
jgi:hypothetical protein